MAGGTNIPLNIIKAIVMIIALDDRQLLGGPAPALFNWEKWHWIKAESDFWSSVRAILEPLLQPYIDKKYITPALRTMVKDTIKKARDYAGYDVQGHRLLLKVAAFGDSDDWMAANIKLGTSLAKKATKGKNDETDWKIPLLNMIGNIIYQHKISVRNPDAPASKKLPAGMRFAKVFRYIGTEPPKTLDQYILVGNAKRGEYISTLSEIELTPGLKLYAYYIARYESNKGELGKPCAMVSAEILF